MQVQFNYANVDASKPLERHVVDALRASVGRFAGRLTRIEAHFADLNSSKKRGPRDKRCLLEARPTGRDPIAIECVGDSYYAAARKAAAKLGRALARRLAK